MKEDSRVHPEVGLMSLLDLREVQFVPLSHNHELFTWLESLPQERQAFATVFVVQKLMGVHDVHSQ